MLKKLREGFPGFILALEPGNSGRVGEADDGAEGDLRVGCVVVVRFRVSGKWLVNVTHCRRARQQSKAARTAPLSAAWRLPPHKRRSEEALHTALCSLPAAEESRRAFLCVEKCATTSALPLAPRLGTGS